MIRCLVDGECGYICLAVLSMHSWWQPFRWVYSNQISQLKEVCNTTQFISNYDNHNTYYYYYYYDYDYDDDDND